MFYLSLTTNFLFKMAQIWIPMFGLLFISLATITLFKKDSNWLKRYLDKAYMSMSGKKLTYGAMNNKRKFNSVKSDLKKVA